MYSSKKGQKATAELSTYGNPFSRWDWDHYVTLTFGRELSEATCIRHWNRFIDSLEHLSHGHVAWLRVLGQHCCGFGNPEVELHFHGLLKCQNVPGPEDVAALWKPRAGDVRVEIVDPSRGPGYYVARMFPYGAADSFVGGLEHFT